ncbi:MAG: glycosyltransferase family 2 protein [Acidobacteria bacterium]|nr:glycosyltransferase family 2 protein [Acidobacteriota bacterium]
MNLVFPPGPSSADLLSLIASAEGDILFIGDPRVTIEPGPRMYERLAGTLAETGAGWVYSDAVGSPRIDYQAGSIRDTFDFGPVVAVPVRAAREVGLQEGLKWGALYDLRLRLSERFPVVRIPEPLYAATRADSRASGQVLFDYVDPRNRDYQTEMETIATRHLERIGALLPPVFEPVPPGQGSFSVSASVIIPVRNREKTILDAVESALSQKAPFPFNVIVVDNHSTDRTPELLRSVSDARLVHLVPGRKDLGIGGCWDLAVSSLHCGRYAVQMDSDDLYAGEHVLARIVAELQAGPYAMVVGSYTMVDFSLKEIPPGLIDHREWSRENGRNNALRVNGFGAPRAFDTEVLRRVGFPNVSYGEDYAVALRVSRDFEIGRIYESVYLCRRWEGNSDSALPIETQNRYDWYKDWLRTVEITARNARNGVSR